MPNDGIIDSPSLLLPATVVPSGWKVGGGRQTGRFGSSIAQRRLIDAAALTDKTTNLYVAVVDATWRNCSLLILVKAQGFESAVAMVYGYDETSQP